MRRVITIIWFLFFSIAGYSAGTPDSESKETQPAIFFLESGSTIPVDLRNYVTAFEDSTRKLTIMQVSSPGFIHRFHKNRFDRKPWQNQSYVIWARLQVKNISGYKQRIFLSGTFGDTVICYKQEGLLNLFDSRMTGKLIPLVNNGKTLIPHSNFDYSIDTNETQTFYFRMSQDNYVWMPEEIPIQLYTMHAIPQFQKKLRNDFLLNGIYFGMALFMALYALALLSIFHEKVYLYLALLQISNFLYFLDQSGLGFYYLYPGNTFLFKYGNTLFLWAIVVWHFMFIAGYLGIRKAFPKIYTALFSLMILTAFSRFIFWPFGLYELGKYLEDYGLLALFFLFFAMIVYMAFRLKIREAKFIFLAEISVFITGIIIELSLTQIIDFPAEYAINLLQAGMAVQMLLWTIAIVDKITQLRSEKDRSRARELEMVLANETLIRDQNVMLEQKVEQRTHELMETRSQLIQSEKMASLGMLTAGIAHEINNPINFINSGAISLQKDYQDLEQIIHSLETMSPEGSAFTEEYGMDDLIKNIPNDIEDIKTGVQQTAEIVKGLRNFTRMDTSELKEADLHEGIDSTLLLISHKLKNGIRIIKDYDQHLGPIQCYPGLLNQVVLSLLLRAIESLDRRINKDLSAGQIELKKTTGEFSLEVGVDGFTRMNHVHPYEIVIITRLVGEELKKQVQVTISDNGIGISEEQRDNIFDPEIDSKEAGRGTTLGLSISQGIIEKHGGTLIVQGEPGKGTTVIFTL